MSNIIKIKKGLDIPLKGAADGKTTVDSSTVLFGIVPDDFPGYTWKAAVKAGDSVKCGDALLFAKEDARLCLTSPVAGTVSEIHRGERRKIEYVSVKKEGEQTQNDFGSPTDKEGILTKLMNSGLFAMIRQRPFDIVPFIGVTPRDIFVTAFDSAPLAAEMTKADMMSDLEEGLKVLGELTDGKVYLSVRAGSGIESRYAEVYEFSGPHPAGNAGIQIAAISPVNKGETVWTLDIVTLARIGRLMSDGRVDYRVEVAVTGSEVQNPRVVGTLPGAPLESLLKGNVKADGRNHRIISGNVLTGTPEGTDGYLRYPYRQVTVIPEGDDADEFMGWASLSPSKMSESRSFLGRFLGRRFNPDARLQGGRRAMIMSGIYDDYVPMDIVPEYLIKAILARDIDRMEALGIYEVAPEDFALAEYADPSKLELQRIVREGLDYMRSEV